MATRKGKVEIEHVDILGQPLAVGSYVAVARSNAMFIGVIVKLTPKMMRARHLKSHADDTGSLIYTANSVKLSGEEAVAYILKHA